MSESIHVEDRERPPQKPTLSRLRIGAEILAGIGVGLAAGLPVAFVISASADRGCFNGLAALALLSLVSPAAYVLGSAVGVYLVGSIGNQTGSFLATLTGVFLAGGVTLFMFPFAFSSHFIGVEKIVLGAVVLLTAPIIATLGFNLTRRYKKPHSS